MHNQDLLQKSLLQELQETFAHEIPITQHIGLTVESYTDEHLVLKAPLENNINHKKTAFAGSLNAVVTLAGWGQLWLILKELHLKGKIVIQDCSSKYIHPVKHDILASCQRPTQLEIARLEKSLRKKGVARIELTAVIHENDHIAVTFKGRYVIQLVDQNTNPSIF